MTPSEANARSTFHGTVSANSRVFLQERQRFYETRLAGLVRAPERSYHEEVAREFRRIVPENCRVLEVGCGFGDLLASLEPSAGVGVDFSAITIHMARQLHPGLDFYLCEAAEFENAEPFDYIVLSDLINDLPDVQRVFEHLQRSAHPRTRLVLNFVNHLWYPVLRLAEVVGLKKHRPQQNWLSRGDVRNLLHLAGWEVIRAESRILWPMRLPFFAIWSTLCNRFLAPLLRPLCLSDFIVARPIPERTPAGHESAPRSERAAQYNHANLALNPTPQLAQSLILSLAPPRLTCTVVVPVRNERGNIEAVVERTPEMGGGTEIIFVEGGSSDGSWEEIQRVMALHPERKLKALKQTGTGKGQAVRQGFGEADGELLFVLDADLTVAPEDLPKFYDLARSGIADLINGVRLVYPLEHEAMRFLNMVANKLFGLAFTWLLGQPVKDTLCGTKALFRRDYQEIARNRGYFGEFDPFGDFDLLFGAARLNLKIVDMPVRYAARTYGKTNISRWRHGLLLLRMVLFAARRLKFV